MRPHSKSLLTNYDCSITYCTRLSFATTEQNNIEACLQGELKVGKEREREREREREMGKSIRELRVEDFVNAGLAVPEAIELDAVLRDVLSISISLSPTDIWRHLVTRRVLKPSYPHSLHQLVYYSIYHPSSHAADAAAPPLYWFPSL